MKKLCFLSLFFLSFCVFSASSMYYWYRQSPIKVMLSSQSPNGTINALQQQKINENAEKVMTKKKFNQNKSEVDYRQTASLIGDKENLDENTLYNLFHQNATFVLIVSDKDGDPKYKIAKQIAEQDNKKIYRTTSYQVSQLSSKTGFIAGNESVIYVKSGMIKSQFAGSIYTSNDQFKQKMTTWLANVGE